MEIRLVGAQLFHEDKHSNGQHEANSRFWQFYENRLKSNDLQSHLTTFWQKKDAVILH